MTSDFCGLARDKRRNDEPAIFQAYFTCCAGNVTAGKYNDGAKENRLILRDRIYDAMKAAWQATARHEVKAWKWRVEPVKLPPRREPSFGDEDSRRILVDPKESKARRGNAAFQLAWLKRAGRPIDFTCLDFGVAQVLHLPGEPFVEFQLYAQSLRPDRFVAVTGYGEGGPGYICTDEAHAEGGYEPTWSLCGPPTEAILKAAIAELLK